MICVHCSRLHGSWEGGGVGVEEAGIMGFKRTGTMALRGKGLLQ